MFNVSIEDILKKTLTIGLSISLALFALSLAMNILRPDALGSYLSLFATLVLLTTPLCGLVAIAVGLAKSGDYKGLLTVIIVVIVIVITLLIALFGSN